MQVHESALASSHTVQVERAFKWRVARTFNSNALLKVLAVSHIQGSRWNCMP